MKNKGSTLDSQISKFFINGNEVPSTIISTKIQKLSKL